jgi:hypothetical protein
LHDIDLQREEGRREEEAVRQQQQQQGSPLAHELSISEMAPLSFEPSSDEEDQPAS